MASLLRAGFVALSALALSEAATRPQQNSDGSCATYTIQAGDGCAKIATAYGITQGDLATYNDKKTWGWVGCGKLFEKSIICISTGSPPLPAAVPNAVCGPIVPGTTKPASNVDLATLNPCRLNACCNIWGQCGITPEFCTAESGPTGNPGTAPPNKNGCISNCGVQIANVQQPAAQINVAYYESFNPGRPCLNMRIQDVDRTKYTHLHWAFLGVNKTDFSLLVNNTYGEWNTFKALTGIKKIISIGGWGFSTGWDTYDIFHRATNGPDNNLKFAMNIINFLKEHNLDGVDLDWEYPGAPDNQGEDWLPPTGDPWDGGWYNILIGNLRKNMPQGKTISVAAPSSYWYLKGFPIKDMALNLDYIVYMTYDLHGQWDYNNKWTQEGCSNGDCLRSHVNGTETAYALSMITKAGVPTNKIVVGVSSYGRSFGMVDKNCDGPMCRFKGQASYATKGRCTGTAGYLANAEIQEIIDQGGNIRTRYDAASSSNILVYGDGQYVAYMNDTTKAQRAANYKAFSFAGTADWAVDLQSFARPSKPGSFVNTGPYEWDLPPEEIVRRYGNGQWDMNTRLQGTAVFYHGSFRTEAEQYVCALRQNGQTAYMMADMYLPLAFDTSNGPRAVAIAQGQEREWFRRVSEIFAIISFGRVRIIWDGNEAMNIGSMQNPNWHSQWDWYEWPIINSRVPTGDATIIQVDPVTFAETPYQMPQDHSTPPKGFAPANIPKKLRSRNAADIDDLNLDGWPGSAKLEKRVAPRDCMSSQSCAACVEDRLSRLPNSEATYANFDDHRRFEPGECSVYIIQDSKEWYDGGGHPYAPLNTTFFDHSGTVIGRAIDLYATGYKSFLSSVLPAPFVITPYDHFDLYNINMSYSLPSDRGKTSIGWDVRRSTRCSVTGWQAKEDANGHISDSGERVIICFFSC